MWTKTNKEKTKSTEVTAAWTGTDRHQGEIINRTGTGVGLIYNQPNYRYRTQANEHRKTQPKHNTHTLQQYASIWSNKQVCWLAYS